MIYRWNRRASQRPRNRALLCQKANTETRAVWGEGRERDANKTDPYQPHFAGDKCVMDSAGVIEYRFYELITDNVFPTTS